MPGAPLRRAGGGSPLFSAAEKPAKIKLDFDHEDGGYQARKREEKEAEERLLASQDRRQGLYFSELRKKQAALFESERSVNRGSIYRELKRSTDG
ncbi:unnamed protein product, partial [Amoebophrya sp. A25]|eukprot:GSA25T00026693001.1